MVGETVGDKNFTDAFELAIVLLFFKLLRIDSLLVGL
jgi:hypothetical protein